MTMEQKRFQEQSFEETIEIIRLVDVNLDPSSEELSDEDIDENMLPTASGWDHVNLHWYRYEYLLSNDSSNMSYGEWLQEKLISLGIEIPELYLDPINARTPPGKIKDIALSKAMESFLSDLPIQVKKAKQAKALLNKLDKIKKVSLDCLTTLFPKDIALFEKLCKEHAYEISDVFHFSSFALEPTFFLSEEEINNLGSSQLSELEEAFGIKILDNFLFPSNNIVMTDPVSTPTDRHSRDAFSVLAQHSIAEDKKELSPSLDLKNIVGTLPQQLKKAFKQTIFRDRLLQTLEINQEMNRDLLRLCLVDGPDKEQARHLPFRCLFEFACLKGNIALIRAIDSNPSIDSAQLVTGPYLFQAIKSSESTAVLQTLNRLNLINITFEGSHCRIMDEYGTPSEITPLHYALILTKPDAVQILISHFRPDISDLEKFFVYAVQQYAKMDISTPEQYACMKLFVNHGVSTKDIEASLTYEEKKFLEAFHHKTQSNYTNNNEDESDLLSPKAELRSVFPKLRPHLRRYLSEEPPSASVQLVRQVSSTLAEEFFADLSKKIEEITKTRDTKDITAFAISYRDQNTPYEANTEILLQKLPIALSKLINLTVESSRSNTIFSTLSLMHLAATGGSIDVERHGIIFIFYKDEMAKQYWAYKLAGVYSVLGVEIDMALSRPELEVIIIDPSISGNPVMLNISLRDLLDGWFEDNSNLLQFSLPKLDNFVVTKPTKNYVYMILSGDCSAKFQKSLTSKFTQMGLEVYSNYSARLTELQHVDLANNATAMLVLWTGDLYEEWLDYILDARYTRSTIVLEASVTRLFTKRSLPTLMTILAPEDEGGDENSNEHNDYRDDLIAQYKKSNREKKVADRKNMKFIPPLFKYLPVYKTNPEIIECLQHIIATQYAPKLDPSLRLFRPPYPSSFVDRLPDFFGHEELFRALASMAKKNKITAHVIATAKQQGGIFFKRLVSDLRKVGLTVSFGKQHLFKAYDAHACMILGGEEFAEDYDSVLAELEIAMLRLYEGNGRARTLSTFLTNGDFRKKNIVPAFLVGELFIDGSPHSLHRNPSVTVGKFLNMVLFPFATDNPEKTIQCMEKAKKYKSLKELCQGRPELLKAYPELDPRENFQREPRYHKNSVFLWEYEEAHPGALYRRIHIQINQRHTITANICLVRKVLTTESLVETTQKEYVDCSALIEGIGIKLPSSPLLADQRAPCVAISPLIQPHVIYDRYADTARVQNTRLDYFSLNDVGGKPMEDLSRQVVKKVKQKLRQHLAIPPGSYKEILHDLLIQLESQLPEKVDKEFIATFERLIKDTYPIWSLETLKNRGCGDPLKDYPELAQDKIALQLKNGSYIFPKLPSVMCSIITNECAHYLENVGEMSCTDFIKKIHSYILKNNARKKGRKPAHRLGYLQRQSHNGFFKGSASRYCIPSDTYDGKTFLPTNAVVSKLELSDYTGVFVNSYSAANAFEVENGLTRFLHDQTKQSIEQHYYYEESGHSELKSEVDNALSSLNALEVGRFQIIGNTFQLSVTSDIHNTHAKDLIDFLQTQPLSHQPSYDPDCMDVSHIGYHLQAMRQDLCTHVAAKYKECHSPYQYNPIVASVKMDNEQPSCITFRAGPVELVRYINSYAPELLRRRKHVSPISIKINTSVAEEKISPTAQITPQQGPRRHSLFAGRPLVVEGDAAAIQLMSKERRKSASARLSTTPPESIPTNMAPKIVIEKEKIRKRKSELITSLPRFLGISPVKATMTIETEVGKVEMEKERRGNMAASLIISEEDTSLVTRFSC